MSVAHRTSEETMWCEEVLEEVGTGRWQNPHTGGEQLSGLTEGRVNQLKRGRRDVGEGNKREQSTLTHV